MTARKFSLTNCSGSLFMTEPWGKYICWRHGDVTPWLLMQK